MLVSKDAIAKAVADMKGKSEKRKFNQSVELAVKLRELDLKRPEARINESIELPTPPSKTTKVAVIAGGDLAVRAKNAGADLVIGREDLDKMGRDKKQARKLAQNYD
ncbi:50S ribosomal protein L1, partial [Candidatus Bathyarchaeota archaeon]